MSSRNVIRIYGLFYALITCLATPAKPLHSPIVAEQIQGRKTGRIAHEIAAIPDEDILEELQASLESPSLASHNRTLVLFHVVRIRKLTESQPLLEDFLLRTSERKPSYIRGPQDPVLGYRYEAEACLVSFALDKSCPGAPSARVNCIMKRIEDKANRGMVINAEGILLHEISGFITDPLFDALDHSASRLVRSIAIDALESSTDERVESLLLDRMDGLRQSDRMLFVRAMGVLARMGGEEALNYMAAVEDGQEQDLATAARESLFIMSHMNRSAAIRNLAAARVADASP